MYRLSTKLLYHLLNAYFKLPLTSLLKDYVSELSGEKGEESHIIMYLAVCNKQLHHNKMCAFLIPKEINSQNLHNLIICFFDINDHKGLENWWVILWIHLNNRNSNFLTKYFIASDLMNRLIYFHPRFKIMKGDLLERQSQIQERKSPLPCILMPNPFQYSLLYQTINCATNLYNNISIVKASTEEEIAENICTYLPSAATSKVGKEMPKENDKSQLVICLNSTFTPPTITSKIVVETTEESDENSQPMLSYNTLDLAQNVTEVITEEAVSEETIAWSPNVCISLPNLQRCDFLQFLESNTCEKIFKLAAIKLESPIICLTYVSDELKKWLFVKIGTDINKTYLSVKHCSFTDLLYHLDLDNSELPFATLYEIIITPIIKRLNYLGINRLNRCIIVPQDLMHLVPYYALLDVENGELFGDKCQLSIMPSISFLQEMNRSKARSNIVTVPDVEGSFLIVGNPTNSSFEPLPDAEREATFIANLLGTDPILHEEATKGIVLYKMKSAKIIHLAVHGPDYLAFSKPEGDMCMAYQGWKLYPCEVETLDILADLVVLSSCGSEKSQKDMVDAFISAGANCVISSLWGVGDESAYIFMQFFYQLWINGLPSWQAFQRTMQFVRSLVEYDYFANWGGFRHIGKTIQLHYNANAKFPITKLLGEVSKFPRPHVDDIKSVLAANNVQVCSTT